MSHKPVELCRDVHEGALRAFFWGEGLRSQSYSHSYRNPKVIDSTSVWIPYTVTGANELGDTVFRCFIFFLLNSTLALE